MRVQAKRVMDLINAVVTYRNRTHGHAEPVPSNVLIANATSPRRILALCEICPPIGAFSTGTLSTPPKLRPRAHDYDYDYEYETRVEGAAAAHVALSLVAANGWVVSFVVKKMRTMRLRRLKNGF